MAPERTVVRSEFGFQFVPRYDFRTVPALDRVLVPAGADSSAKQQVVAAWASNQAYPPVEDIFQHVGNGETAYEATFKDLARTQGGTLARADASILFYVMDAASLQGADWSVRDGLTPLLLGLIGAALVYGATHLKIAPRARLQPTPLPA
jgi:hypothetical protein